MMCSPPKQRLLKKLAYDYGKSVDQMISESVIDSVVPGICPECFYTTGVEPDATGNWCEVCDAPTVISCLVLYGII